MTWLELFNFLHYIGIAWGVGGATAVSIITYKSEKNPEINHAAMKIIHTLSKLIWLGLILLIISGIGIMFFIKWPINKQLLLIKHLLVVLLLIIGIIIGFKVNKMKHLAPKPNQKPSISFLKAKKQLKVFSTINLLIWYIIVILSVFM